MMNQATYSVHCSVDHGIRWSGMTADNMAHLAKMYGLSLWLTADGFDLRIGDKEIAYARRIDADA